MKLALKAGKIDVAFAKQLLKSRGFENYFSDEALGFLIHYYTTDHIQKSRGTNLLDLPNKWSEYGNGLFFTISDFENRFHKYITPLKDDEKYYTLEHLRLLANNTLLVVFTNHHILFREWGEC